MLIWFLWVLAGKVPVVLDPKPIEPEGQVQKESASFVTEHYLCKLEAIHPDRVVAVLQDLGVDASQLKRAEVARILERSVLFKISLTNRGESTLLFNPDHVILGSGRGPVASQLDMATFWPATLPDGNRDQETLARAFAGGTVTLAPNQSHTQILAFRAFDRRFPKKIYLEINQLYTGVDQTTIKCAFLIKYRDV